MSLEKFLNPHNENESGKTHQLSKEQELWDIITQNTGVSTEMTSEKQAIKDEAVEMRPLPTATQALEALENSRILATTPITLNY